MNFVSFVCCYLAGVLALLGLVSLGAEDRTVSAMCAGAAFVFAVLALTTQ